MIRDIRYRHDDDGVRIYVVEFEGNAGDCNSIKIKYSELESVIESLMYSKQVGSEK